jgi:chemotaxis protein CheD
VKATVPVTPAAHDSREIIVNVADFGVGRGNAVLVTSGLGSCVAIVLYHARSKTAALAHVLLPDVEYAREPINPAKFASTAVPLLVAEMRRAGAMGPLIAKLAGGARMFGSLLSSGVNMGERNVEASRKALAAAGIPILGEDVGGEHGRSIHVDAATGQMRVHSLQRGDRIV